MKKHKSENEQCSTQQKILSFDDYLNHQYFDGAADYFYQNDLTLYLYEFRIFQTIYSN